jgi:predicted NBD/HSP70 family sugar kinase
MANKIFVGVDIGGTNIKSDLLSHNLEVLALVLQVLSTQKKALLNSLLIFLNGTT